MLIGCCHCGETPSESTPPPPSDSTPPSESVLSEESGSVPDYTYGECGCAAVPKEWEIVWPAMAANTVCPIPAGTYILSRTVDKPVPGGTPDPYCNWESTQIAPRMRVLAGVWTCITWTPPAFRLMVAPTLFGNKIQVYVTHSVWIPAGFGGAYQDYFTQYATAPPNACIYNGVLATGGSSIIWPNSTDVTFPYTFVSMPAPSSITIRPKL